MDQTGPSHPALQAIHDTPVAPYLGDVLISYPQAAAQAQADGENLKALELLEQEPELDDSRTVLGNVELGVAETKAMLSRFNEISEALADPEAELSVEEQARLEKMLQTEPQGRQETDK